MSGSASQRAGGTKSALIGIFGDRRGGPLCNDPPMRASHAFLTVTTLVLCAAPVAHAQTTRTKTLPGDQLIAELNAARAVARDCGATHFNAAPALVGPNRYMTRVAAGQASTMAAASTLSHTPGLTTALGSAGYKATLAMDLIAGDSGSGTAASTVAGWLASPQHCAVVMDPNWVDVGTGYATNAASTTSLKHFWIAVFAKP